MAGSEASSWAGSVASGYSTDGTAPGRPRSFSMQSMRPGELRPPSHRRRRRRRPPPPPPPTLDYSACLVRARASAVACVIDLSDPSLLQGRKPNGDKRQSASKSHLSEPGQLPRIIIICTITLIWLPPMSRMPTTRTRSCWRWYRCILGTLCHKASHAQLRQTELPNHVYAVQRGLTTVSHDQTR